MSDSPPSEPRKWCDFNCPDASFPKETALDGAGSCRTFVAVYCTRLQKLVPKNMPCQVQKTESA